MLQFVDHMQPVIWLLSYSTIQQAKVYIAALGESVRRLFVSSRVCIFGKNSTWEQTTEKLRNRQAMDQIMRVDASTCKHMQPIFKNATWRRGSSPIEACWGGFQRWQLEDVVEEVPGSSSPWRPAVAPREDDHPLVIHASKPPVLRRSKLLTAPLLPPEAAEAELLHHRRCWSPPTMGTTSPSLPLSRLAPSPG
jgi:hypothetical protein